MGYFLVVLFVAAVGVSASILSRVFGIVDACARFFWRYIFMPVFYTMLAFAAGYALFIVLKPVVIGFFSFVAKLLGLAVLFAVTGLVFFFIHRAVKRPAPQPDSELDSEPDPQPEPEPQPEPQPQLPPPPPRPKRRAVKSPPPRIPRRPYEGATGPMPESEPLYDRFGTCFTTPDRPPLPGDERKTT